MELLNTQLTVKSIIPYGIEQYYFGNDADFINKYIIGIPTSIKNINGKNLHKI